MIQLRLHADNWRASSRNKDERTRRIIDWMRSAVKVLKRK